ncbi:MAG: hypothetical protein MR270_05205 [Erysipelotrichaceae bacterium]|nr:hypothetical protein [Erysipelotrichaceae bacterium]
MNKLVKLPLFLGICGAACAGILAGVYALTSPIVEANKAKAEAEAYLKIFNKYNVLNTEITVEKTMMLEDDTLYNSGCESVATVQRILGRAYTCKATGYGGEFSFQVAFADGKYLGYTDLGNNETSGFGKDLIAKIDNLISNKDVNNAVNDYVEFSGVSKTGKPLTTAIEVCRLDYLSWLDTQSK